MVNVKHFVILPHERWTACVGSRSAACSTCPPAVWSWTRSSAAVRGRRNEMGAPEWTNAALLLRGTIKDSSLLSSPSSTACVCSVQTVVLVVLSDGVEKLVVSAFLVDMHDCSLVLPGGEDKKDIVAHPAPRAHSIRVQLLVAQSPLSGCWKE